LALVHISHVTSQGYYKFIRKHQGVYTALRPVLIFCSQKTQADGLAVASKTPFRFVRNRGFEMSQKLHGRGDRSETQSGQISACFLQFPSNSDIRKL